MKRKNIVIILCLVSLILCSCSYNVEEICREEGKRTDYRVSMISDIGDITDQGFNQSTYQACKAFCDDNNIMFTYKMPSGDNTASRVIAVESAIDEGYNVIVMPGFSFTATLIEVAEKYPDIKFIVLDVSAGDLLSAGVPRKGEAYDYNPSNWNVMDYYHYENVYDALFKEEISGYLAGYTAVMLGYNDLGFLGGMAVPGVLRFGYGYVQGINEAAKEKGITVNMKYAYANTFNGDAEISAAMETWYANGTEVVFSCGGGIFVSVSEAASKHGGKVIGVDTDQKNLIDGMYGEGITITSALKGLYPATYDALDDIISNGKWDGYRGKILSLGLISGTDPDANYLSLPINSTMWNDDFTEQDYRELVNNIYLGNIVISDDISHEPVTSNVNVEWLGSIK